MEHIRPYTSENYPTVFSCINSEKAMEYLQFELSHRQLQPVENYSRIESSISECIEVLTPEWSKIWLFQNIVNLLTKLRGEGISIPDPDGVIQYLIQFKDMIDITYRIAHLAKQELKDAQLSLEVYKDPEIDYRHLVLYARFPRYDENTMERIEEVVEQYIDELAGKSGWLLLTTDFKPPQR